MLADAGLRVASATEEPGPRATVRRDPPAAVVADVDLARAGVAALAAWLWAARVPLIVTSGRYDDVDLPGVRFLRKPVDPGTLLAAVAAALKRA